MNNHDTSSTGANLDLSCSYDSFMSQQYFDESFTRCEHDSATFHFINYGNFEQRNLADFDLYTFTKKELLDTAIEHDGYGIEALKEVSLNVLDKPLYKLTKTELQDVVTEIFYGDTGLIEFLQKLTPKYETVEVRGHSQGNYAEVIYFPEDVNYWKITESELKEHFQHLFYDAPIYCRLTINDDINNEVYLDEALTDSYEWDRDLILEYAKDNIKHDKKAYILEWLQDNLPEYPDHE